MKKVQVANLEKVAEITKASFPDAWPKSYLENLHKKYKNGFFVAEKDGQLVGYILGCLKEKKLGWIKAAAVNPNYRGQGIGTEMVDFIIKELKRAGAKKIGLHARTANWAGISFYQKLDFKIIKTVENYFPNGDSAYILEKNLGG